MCTAAKDDVVFTFKCQLASVTMQIYENMIVLPKLNTSEQLKFQEIVKFLMIISVFWYFRTFVIFVDIFTNVNQ